MPGKLNEHKGVNARNGVAPDVAPFDDQSAPLFGPRRICVIVCGMHRTGTSAVSRLINLLGADIAKDVEPPKEDNIRGFWEPREIVRIHNNLLEALDSSSADPLPLPPDWLQSPFAERALRELTGVVESEFADSRLFTVKDPRLARLLPLWFKLLDDLSIRAVVVIPFRHPSEVAASLEKRDRMAPGTAMLLYLESYLQAELASRGRRRCFVSYDQLLADWRQLERKLTDQLDVRLPQASARLLAEVEHFLSPDLRHHWHNRGELRGMTDAPPIMAELFDILLKAEITDDGGHLHKTFDDLSKRVDDEMRLFREFAIAERKKVLTVERSASWRLTAPLRWVNSNVLRTIL